MMTAELAAIACVRSAVLDFTALVHPAGAEITALRVAGVAEARVAQLYPVEFEKLGSWLATHLHDQAGLLVMADCFAKRPGQHSYIPDVLADHHAQEMYEAFPMLLDEHAGDKASPGSLCALLEAEGLSGQQRINIVGRLSEISGFLWCAVNFARVPELVLRDSLLASEVVSLSVALRKVVQVRAAVAALMTGVEVGA